MKLKLFSLITIIGISLIWGCKDTDTPDLITHDTTPYELDYGYFPTPQIAEDNQLTQQTVQLGRMLFYEKMLSADGTQSCASCHMQQFAFTDTSTFSIGIKGLPGKRQAMSVFNMAWHSNEFFWDGRAHLLRDQSLMPIQDELEMNETLENVITKLGNSQMYKDQFMRAFGSEEVTSFKMSLAMEQFMNSIVSNNSKYDRFLEDSTVFSESEKRGHRLFFLEYNAFFPKQSGADCAHCHGGDNFENDKYMNNGLDLESDMKDLGRQAVTGKTSDMGKFKVTTLRNIELTPPYIHDGRFKTLEEVVAHYNNGLKPSSTLDPALEQTRGTGLRLSEQDIADLVAFLKTLTDTELITNTAFSDPF